VFCRFSLQIPRWDTSRLRAKGARLKTFGGRASGPEPLEALFLFAVNMFTHARGRRLTPLEAHDLVCKVAEIVVVGGVRRWAGLQQCLIHNSFRQLVLFSYDLLSRWRRLWWWAACAGGPGWKATPSVYKRILWIVGAVLW
jgi:hypothetical protein